MHVRGDESFSGQVRNPVTYIVLTRRYKSAPLTIKGVAYIKCGVVAVVLTGEVWGI